MDFMVVDNGDRTPVLAIEGAANFSWLGSLLYLHLSYFPISSAKFDISFKLRKHFSEYRAPPYNNPEPMVA